MGVERMAARRVSVRSVRKRRMWRFRSRVEEGVALDEGERGSKGVGSVEGNEVLTKGLSLREESELVDMTICLRLATARTFGIVGVDIVSCCPFTCRGCRLALHMAFLG